MRLEQNKSVILPLLLSTLTLCAANGCGNDPAMTPGPTTGAGTGASGTGGTSSGGVAGVTATAGTTARAGTTATGTAGISGSSGVSGSSTAGTSGAGTTGAGTTAAAGSGPAMAGTGGTAMTMRPEASIRNPKYQSLAPAMGEALPKMTTGAWTWVAPEGAVSRDGTPAGFFYKVSKTGSKNLLIYMAGGGVCADGFFCNMNPPNKDASLTAENVGAGIFNIFGPDQEAQDPNGERWQSGIFKDDPANPAKDWNMVFIPYVTGDVFFGSKPNGTVPDVEGTFQFVGKANMQKFFARVVPTFSDAEIVVLSGSSAGGIGALLNAPFLMDAFIDQGKGARVFVLDDAGPFFDDQHLEVCIQKRYRDLYALDESFPQDCPACRSADGGGVVKAWLAYLADRYPDRVLGGLVDSDQDEIMKFFFSEGLENCGYIENPIVGLLAYPEDRYPAALKHILTDLVDPSRMATYIWSGDLHQNLFQTATADRFYMKNGLDKTVAEWFAGLITGKGERIGVIQ
ncbi:MAG TPA: pectin acetylesterase-family hydrolase [Polyangiales bacterium]|nr:pectin acetylesterase-family hydrolase [Polyangiales bacterium]